MGRIVCGKVCLWEGLSVGRFVCWKVCLSEGLSVGRFVCQSVVLLVRLSVGMSEGFVSLLFSQSVSLVIHWSVAQLVCPSVDLSIS